MHEYAPESDPVVDLLRNLVCACLTLVCSLRDERRVLGHGHDALLLSW